MKTSIRGIELIREFEGYGHAGGVSAGMVITEEPAEMKLYFEKNDYLCGL